MDGGNTLRKVALTGGPAITLSTLDGLPRGATWGPDDTIIVATSIHRRPACSESSVAGGTTTVLTRPDRAQGEADHLWPEWLPGGRAVLFTITAVAGGLDAAQVAVLDLRTGTSDGARARRQPRSLRGERAGSPTRAEREGGHLVYAAAGTLRAVPFDLARLETRGTPVPVVPAVVTTSSAEWTPGGGRRHAGLCVAERRGWCGDTAHARMGGPAGSRDADPGAAARLRLSAPVTRWHAHRGVRPGSERRTSGSGIWGGRA